MLMGIKAPREMKKASNRAVNELAAIAWRSIGAVAWTVCSGAIDTATKIKPTSVAPIPALAKKKFVNAAGTTLSLYLRINCTINSATARKTRFSPTRTRSAKSMYLAIDEVLTSRA